MPSTAILTRDDNNPEHEYEAPSHHAVTITTPPERSVSTNKRSSLRLRPRSVDSHHISRRFTLQYNRLAAWIKRTRKHDLTKPFTRLVCMMYVIVRSSMSPRRRKDSVQLWAVYSVWSDDKSTMSISRIRRVEPEPSPSAPKPAPKVPPRGTWVCCSCRQANLFATCPNRCAVCGHYKCAYCYRY